MGTPAATSRGMDEEAMIEIGRIIALTLKSPEDSAVLEQARARVVALTDRYPLYPEMKY
ncbi:Serine hydroxymethyltransferase [compost metagenome]